MYINELKCIAQLLELVEIYVLLEEVEEDLLKQMEGGESKRPKNRDEILLPRYTVSRMVKKIRNCCASLKH